AALVDEGRHAVQRLDVVQDAVAVQLGRDDLSGTIQFDGSGHERSVAVAVPGRAPPRIAAATLKKGHAQDEVEMTIPIQIDRLKALNPFTRRYRACGVEDAVSPAQVDLDVVDLFRRRIRAVTGLELVVQHKDVVAAVPVDVRGRAAA